MAEGPIYISERILMSVISQNCQYFLQNSDSSQDFLPQTLIFASLPPGSLWYKIHELCLPTVGLLIFVRVLLLLVLLIVLWFFGFIFYLFFGFLFSFVFCFCFVLCLISLALFPLSILPLVCFHRTPSSMAWYIVSARSMYYILLVPWTLTYASVCSYLHM